MKIYKKIIVFLFFAFLGILYLHNLTRDIYGGDIGDLVTAAYVFGVAHPPGYPLFSFLGYIMSHIPFPLPIVSRVGLISVISSLAGLYIFYKFCQSVSKNLFISLLSTSILGLSYLFWLTAEIPEGLGLNNFFVIVILFFAIRFYNYKKSKDLYILALFTGLSMTHQFFIMTLFPAIFLLVIKHYKYIFTKKRFFIALLWLLAGFSVYIYVPIAASRNPMINWDNAVNLKNFLHLILRQDYGGIANAPKTVSIQIRLVFVTHYLKTLVDTFSFQILFVVLLGAIHAFKLNKRLALSIIIGFLLTGIVCFYFTAGPIFTTVAWGVAERYYSQSMIVMMFLVPYGLVLIQKFINKKFSKPLYSYIILGYFLIIPFLLFKYNFPKTDLSKTQIGQNLAENILISLPKNAVIFTTGDNLTFDLWYAKFVLNQRPDVNVINPPYVSRNNFLSNRVIKYYSENSNIPTNSVIFKVFNDLIDEKRVFITNQLTTIPKDTVLMPRGIVYQVIRKKDIPAKEIFLLEIDRLWKKIKVQKRSELTPAEQNFVTTEVPLFYSRAMASYATFLTNNYEDKTNAEQYLKEAITIDETNSLAYGQLAVIQAQNKECKLAFKNIQTAISLYPIWNWFYQQQYYIALDCNTNKNTLDEFKVKYKARFNEDIEKIK